MDTEPGPGALLGAIDARAEEERARLLAEAEARARGILAAADAECARVKAAALAGLERELAVDQVRLIGEARMRARTEGLARRRALLDEAFRLAGERIQRLKAGPGAAAALAALAEEARQAVGEPCDVQASAADWTVTATSADGRRRAENGPDGRLARARAAAEHGVARRLFGGAGAP
jgi:vacuolar-type H+-ATPase subunit E/Vma4